MAQPWQVAQDLTALAELGHTYGITSPDYQALCREVLGDLDSLLAGPLSPSEIVELGDALGLLSHPAPAELWGHPLTHTLHVVNIQETPDGYTGTVLNAWGTAPPARGAQPEARIRVTGPQDPGAVQPPAG